jgi:hypothetical protein
MEATTAGAYSLRSRVCLSFFLSQSDQSTQLALNLLIIRVHLLSFVRKKDEFDDEFTGYSRTRFGVKMCRAVRDDLRASPAS